MVRPNTSVAGSIIGSFVIGIFAIMFVASVFGHWRGVNPDHNVVAEWDQFEQPLQ